MPTLTGTAHVWLDETGREWIDDTNVKVIEIALDHVAYGWNVEELHENFPEFSLAQLHAALGYYYDYKEDFDRRMEESRQRAEAMAAGDADSPFRRRLRDLGKL